ncbi:MAG: sigma 54-interacting transcriptional regulator [Anaeromyxobacter sp.]
MSTGGPAVEGRGGGEAVRVCDPSPARRERVAGVLARCGARPLLAPPGAPGDAGAPVALVAVGAGAGEASGPELAQVRAWAGAGGKVVCYTRGERGWPVTARCRVLLAGAVALLDSDGADFEQELRRWVVRLLAAVGSQEAERQALQAVMESVGIVGESAAICGVMRWVARVSRLSDLPALISGGTGTGKELVARAIHRLDGKRHDGPFVPVNCAAISPALAESELFGHRRGAFTGAEQERKGLFRAADGGILFLDEIGEMELPLQAKLLRALQEGRVLGIGEDRETEVDVRVVAASNRDLEQLVQAGRFRADLLHRLNVLSIRIPPLRERPADVGPLVAHFLHKHRALAPGGPDHAAGRLIEALAQAPLPGNVRELENLVRYALVRTADDAPLDLGDLPAVMLRQLAGAAVPDEAVEAPPGAAGGGLPLVRVLDENGWNLSRSIDHLERLLIEAALVAAKWNQAQTARLLGITPRSVYNKLRKHQLAQKSRA